MKKIYILFTLLLFAGSQSFSQVTWEKLISFQSTDVFRCVQEANSGYVVAGYIADSTVNDTDAYVVKFDYNGDTLWTYRYNGTLNGKDLFYKIIATTDGGYITCGYTTSVGLVSDDILYIKLSSTGHMQWIKTFGNNNGKERAQDIIQTLDGGYTIAGYTTAPPAQYYDALIIHTNSSGDTLWTKIVGNSNYDDANSIKLLADGGYITGGQSNNGANGLDMFLIRLNASGDTLWTKRFGTTETDNIECVTLVNGGYILAGNTSTLTTGDDGYLVKTDTSGIVIWSKSYGGTEPDDFHRVEKVSSGGYIATGTTSSYGPSNPNMWLMRTDDNGDSLWAKTFGGDNHDHGYSGIETSDGGFIIAGHSGSFGFRNEDGYIVKVGPDGNGTNHLAYVTAYSLASPTCSATSSDVKIVVRNFGNEPVSNINLEVNITGGVTQTLTTTIPGTLAPHDVTTIILSPAINTTGGNAITFHAFTGTANDVYPANNSFTKTLTLSTCTGIDELHADLGFTIYPNPTDGNFEIAFSENYPNTKIDFLNFEGKNLLHYCLENTYEVKRSIDFSSYSKGLYLLRVITDKGVDIRKIVLD
jgi:hypothetical protein